MPWFISCDIKYFIWSTNRTIIYCIQQHRLVVMTWRAPMNTTIPGRQKQKLPKHMCKFERTPNILATFISIWPLIHNSTPISSTCAGNGTDDDHQVWCRRSNHTHHISNEQNTIISSCSSPFLSINTYYSILVFCRMLQVSLFHAAMAYLPDLTLLHT